VKEKIAFITGATAGFGEAMAHKFASEKYHLVLVARREDKLHALCRGLETNYGIKTLPLVLDVRENRAVEEKIKSMAPEWSKVDVLINNAGLAVGRDAFHEGQLDDWERMIDTNIKGLMYVTRAIVPMMIENSGGHIINIGSIAGKEVYPGGSVYSATKFAVDALTRSMRIDFLPLGIKVSQVSPGAAETEFSLVRFKGDAEKASHVYNGFDPLTATDIAEAAWFIASRPAHVCINDLVIMPTSQASSVHIHKPGKKNS